MIGGTRFAHCTLSGKAASGTGAALHVRDDGGGGAAFIENTIIAFSATSGAVACASGVLPVLS